MKFLCTAIMALALFAFTGCGGSKSSALPATQNAPTFSAAAANDFVKSLSQNANDFAAALKTKDQAQVTAALGKFNETFSKGQSTLASVLKPDEVQKLQGWLNSLTQQMGAAQAAAAVTPAAK